MLHFYREWNAHEASLWKYDYYIYFGGIKWCQGGIKWNWKFGLCMFNMHILPGKWCVWVLWACEFWSM